MFPRDKPNSDPPILADQYPPTCPRCQGATILFTKRKDGSRRFVCATEGFGASCMGEVVRRPGGSELVGGDGYL